MIPAVDLLVLCSYQSGCPTRQASHRRCWPRLYLHVSPKNNWPCLQHHSELRVTVEIVQQYALRTQEWQYGVKVAGGTRCNKLGLLSEALLASDIVVPLP